MAVQSHHRRDLTKYPARTSINLSLGHASNNFFCSIKTFKTGPPNPFVIQKNISKPRDGALDLPYISPKAIIQKEKETRTKTTFNDNVVSKKSLIGHGESASTNLAFLHPVKVISKIISRVFTGIHCEAIML